MFRKITSITRGLAIIAIIASFWLVFTGCDRTVRITIEDKDSGEKIEFTTDRIVSDKVFKPSPKQVAESLWVMPFPSGNNVIDLIMREDTVLVLKDYGGVQGFQIEFDDVFYNIIGLGEMMTPGPVQAFSHNDWNVKVLCGNTWYSTSIQWPPNPPRHTPTWYEADRVPKEYRRVINLGGGRLLYELQNNEILISKQPKTYEEFPQQGTISNAIVVGGDRLITALQNQGVFVHYPLIGDSEKYNIKISEILNGECLLYDNNQLFIGDSTGTLRWFKPPDSWAENRLWDEMASISFDATIKEIHPLQFGPQRVYIVSLSDGSCHLTSLDDENKFVSGGELGGDSYLPIVKPVPYDKIIDYGPKSVLCKGIDGAVYTIRPKMFFRMYPQIDIPEEAKYVTEFIRPEKETAFEISTINTDPLKIFDPGFEVDELDLIDEKLICRGEAGIGIYNIDDPGRPKLEQTYSISKANKGAFIHGKPGYFAYGLKSGRVQIVDLFSPIGTMPSEICSMELPGRFYFHYAFEANHVLFVFSNQGHCAVYDVIDPGKPAYLGYIDESIINFKEEGDRVYSENGLFYTLGRDFYEINPLAEGGPNIIRAFRNNGYSSNSLIMKSGYLWNPASGTQGWVRKITDDGWEQVEVKLPSVNSIWGIKRLSEDLMMASHFNEATVYDIGNLPEVKPVLRIEKDGTVKDVLISNQYVYCAFSREGIAIYTKPEIPSDNPIPNSS